MKRRSSLQFSAATCLVLAMICASASDDLGKISENDRREMAETLEDMVPLHIIMEKLIGRRKDGMLTMVGQEQRDCYTRVTSREGVVSLNRREVDAFADEDPESFAASLTVIREGAGAVMKRRVSQAGPGISVSGKVGLDSGSPAELEAFAAFTHQDRHARARKMVGFDEASEGSRGTALRARLDSLLAELKNVCGSDLG